LPLVVLLSLGAAAALVGCEKSQTRKAIVLAPTTRQTPSPATRVTVATAPASRPALAATTEPAKRASYMYVGGARVEFPEAKLIVRKEGDKLSAFLVSNDPPEVINPTYQGNRYYFEMTLDAVDDLKNIAQAEFRYRAASGESQDTPNGIFLDGDRQHLQPYDIRVVFDKEGDHLVADIQGQFIYFTKGNAVGTPIMVTAQLAATPQTK
jgi:hypothetical protein